jgi:hypothetical protein
MRKKDPIFWSAAGIFVLALGLFAVTQNQFWLALMIGSYLLRPTLGSLGLARKYVDERQMSLHHRSGNMGFVATLVMCVICMLTLAAKDNHDFELFAMTIIFGLAAKALFNVVLARDFRIGAARILIGVGLLVALFSVFDAESPSGIIISAGPGLIIAGLGLLSKKFPLPVGILTVIVACAIMGYLIASSGNFKSAWTQVVVAMIIGLPLLAAGVSLLLPDRTAAEAK